jgi:hypothetical protein
LLDKIGRIFLGRIPPLFPKRPGLSRSHCPAPEQATNQPGKTKKSRDFTRRLTNNSGD